MRWLLNDGPLWAGGLCNPSRAGGGAPPAQVAPAFTTAPSLTGSTALGSTITVSLGAASGTPAPTLTGTLTRPGKAAAAVLDGATFAVEAADQGGTITLDVTATNSAGSATASASVQIDAPVIPAVTDFYGTSLGQIPFDLRLDEPAKQTLNGNLITAVVNDGGAGEIYAATATSALAPVTSTGPGAADFGEARTQYLTPATSPNLGGGHLLVPLFLPDFATNKYLFGAVGNNNLTTLSLMRTTATTGYLRLRNGQTAATDYFSSPDFTVPLGRWMLLEVRLDRGRLTYWIDGTKIHDGTYATDRGWLANAIGYAGATTSNRWTGKIGRIVSVICDPLYSADNPEQAVRVARQMLAAQYGLPLQSNDPIFTILPRLTGTRAIGDTVTVYTGQAFAADSKTATLARPGKVPVTVQDGYSFPVDASDQTGTITLDVVATNAAGSVTASATFDFAPAPSAIVPDDGGNKLGTVTSVTRDGVVSITNSLSYLNDTEEREVKHYMVQADGMAGKTLTVLRSAAAPNVDGSNMSAWQMTWTHDPHGTWHPFDSVTNAFGTVVAASAAPLTQDRVYIARRPMFTNTRWDRAIARWKASPLTSPTPAANADWVIGTLPANEHAPAMDCHAFRFGTGAAKFVLTGAIHCDEHIASYNYEGLVDWLLSSDPDAVWLRNRLTFYCYPKVNAQGRWAGATRVEVTTGKNSNRIFTTGSTIPLASVLQTAWATDLAGGVSGNIDFHDYARQGPRGQIFRGDTGTYHQRLAEVFKARTGATLAVQGSSDDPTIGERMRSSYGASEVCIVTECGIQAAYNVDEYHAFGRDLGKALKLHYETLP